MLRYYVLGLIMILVVAGNIGCTKGVPIIESMSALSDSADGGTVNDPVDPGIPATPVSLTVEAAFSLAPNWNDYIAVSSLGVRENLSCGSPSNANYGSKDGCVHGGEVKKVVLPANFTTCANLSLEDSLGVFNWSCEQTDSAVKFTSLLKPGKGLVDLIAAGGSGGGVIPAWKKNSVRLLYKSTGVLKVVGESTSNFWWGNEIAEAPAGGNLDNVGTIYVVSSDLDIMSSFVPNADKIGLVTLGTAKISAASGLRVIDNWSSAKEYFWLEGKLEGVGASVTALYGKFAWSRFQNLSLRNFLATPSVNIDSSEGLLIQNLLLRDSEKFYLTSSNVTAIDMRISFALGVGLYLSGANHNSFHRLVVNSTGGSNGGIHLLDSSNNSFSQFAVMHADAAGVQVSRNVGVSSNNIFSHGNISKNNGFGLLLDAGVTDSFVNSVVSFNQSSFDFKSYDSSARIYNSVYGGTIYAPGNWCGFDALGCTGSGSPTPVPSIQGGFLTSPVLNSDYSTLLDMIASKDFFSRLFLSLTNLTSGSINGLGGTSYSLADWRLNANSPLYIRSYNGTTAIGTDINPESIVNTDTGECSGEVTGAVMTGGQTLLYHAIEKAYDGVGDDDGLCEANETCYYAPNIGFFQGESNLDFPEVLHCKIPGSSIETLKQGQYAISGP